MLGRVRVDASYGDDITPPGRDAPAPTARHPSPWPYSPCLMATQRLAGRTRAAESAAYSPRSSSNANSLWRHALAKPTQVVTESQIHDSHADSRVRVLRGQPGSPVSTSQRG